jgi:chaperonin cofactor prefoldin
MIADLPENQEPDIAPPTLDIGIDRTDDLAARVTALQQQERDLQEKINSLQATYNRMLQQQVVEDRAALGRLVQEATSELEQRKQALQIAVEQLEKRRDRIREEMRKSFAGTSQELAIRVQGFKDYLVGSLQDLATAAEQLELSTAPAAKPERAKKPEPMPAESEPATSNPQFAESAFQATVKQIRSLLDKYRHQPDYYGPPWQLRRTFEPVHAQRVADWFFKQGGRGALPTMGSRLQNILIASAVISILRRLYGDRLRTLVLVNSPERLGEWRRGLQDCLGISRSDFSPEQGIVLFEAPEPLVMKADRLMDEGQMPLIIIDETENQISLGLLQFPLWLAFAPDPQQMSSSTDDYRY